MLVFKTHIRNGVTIFERAHLKQVDVIPFQVHFIELRQVHERLPRYVLDTIVVQVHLPEIGQVVEGVLLDVADLATVDENLLHILSRENGQRSVTRGSGGSSCTVLSPGGQRRLSSRAV